MDDLAHWHGNDLSASATGDLLSVSGAVRGQQRVLRRLMTMPGSYIWHPTYGAGLPQFIGQPVDPLALIGLVRQQVLLEPAVAKNPLPVVTAREISGGYFIRIVYTDSDTGSPTELAFDVTE